MSIKTIKLIIADDHQIISDGLKAMLNSNPEISIIGVASNGKEAVKLSSIIIARYYSNGFGYAHTEWN